MITEFIVYGAETVPENYSWDIGAPLDTTITTTTAYATTSYTSGYAPGLRVFFYNNGSIPDAGFDQISYNWNFGDYYNSYSNNISLSCISLVQHTFIMPGTYTVTLTQIQSKKRIDLDPSVLARLCLGKYSINWYWDNLVCGNLQETTWDQTMCTPPVSAGIPRSKWWAEETQCFQKHCKFWSWYDLANNADSSNPVRWTETDTDAEFEKLWMFEDNETVCAISDSRFLDTIESQEQTVIKSHIVEVKELPPVAEIACISEPIGTSPHTVTLSPTGCRPGSFPIDRIDWDFGDGSPIITHTRYVTPTGSNIVFNNKFSSDPNDVRNYDIIHTYTRDSKTYPVFYPSLTCYSANTNTQDSCSTIVGPISFPSLTNINLIKARNTLKGNIYAFDVNNSIAFSTTIPTTSTPLTPTSPQNRLLVNVSTPNSYFGNPNDNIYPSVYIPTCTLVASDLIPTTNVLTTEDNDPTNGDSVIDLEEGIPIVTDLEFFIEP